MFRRCGLLLALLGLVASALAVPASARESDPKIIDDIVVESFDGTPILSTLMLPAGASARNRVPVVLMTHGWGGSRTRTPSGITKELLGRGYAVFTWDSRGFGESGGEANVGAPDFEVKDAQALIDYLARRDEIALDSPGDPRLGWIGGSNAAGVQFNTAAVDRRVDALVPEISWGDLIGDLFPGGVVRQTWDLLLYGAGGATATTQGLGSPAGPQTGAFAPQIHQAFVEGSATGELSEEIRKWFAERSTTRRSGRITAPTLIIQGTVDTLFPLQDGFENYSNLVEANTPVKLMTYCSGHTLGCDYPGGASGSPKSDDGGSVYRDRIVAWLERYVANKRVATGPEFEWQAQDGYYYKAPRYPLPRSKMVEAKPVETSPLAGPGGAGGDGPAEGGPAPEAELSVTAVRKEILGPVNDRTPLVGVPRVKLSGTVTGAQAYVFFELVDVSPDGERMTVDEQVMPQKLALGKVDERFELNGVSWILERGHSLELEITTGSAQFAIPRTGPYAVELKAKTALPLTTWGGALRRTRAR